MVERERQAPFRFHGAQELGLDFVEDGTAHQRIEPLQRLRLLVGFEPINGGEQELIGARRELCRADTEYGRAPRRCVSSQGLIESVTRTSPSCGSQRDRPRAQRVVTDRRSASLRRKR